MSSTDEERFDLLIQINRDAFQDGQYNVAYYALAGALHWAKDHSESQKLWQVRDVATAQAHHVNACASEYDARHSSQARSRSSSTHSFYTSLVHLVQAYIFIVEQRQSKSVEEDATLQKPREPWHDSALL